MCFCFVLWDGEEAREDLQSVPGIAIMPSLL